MQRISLNISGKIDPFTVAIYDLIASVAKSQGIKFFIVGATARDLVMHHGYSIAVRRATNDIDLAVRISSWDEFEALKRHLINTGKFSETQMVQRLLYQDRIPVDIVPFGAITEADGSISWPPDYAVHMNILGFEDAYTNAMQVMLKAEPSLEILVASPSSLAALKLMSWKERAPENTKDAIDLLFIIRNYLDIGNYERLYGEDGDLVTEDFDYDRAGARLLGRDIARILGKDAIAVIYQIVEEQTAESDRLPLVEDMTRGMPGDGFQENLLLLKYLKQGLLDIAGKI